MKKNVERPNTNRTSRQGSGARHKETSPTHGTGAHNRGRTGGKPNVWGNARVDAKRPPRVDTRRPPEADAKRPARVETRPPARVPPVPAREENKPLARVQALDHLKSSMAGRSIPSENEERESKKAGWRINRYLARAGYGSRRQAERYVLGGRVEVNGKRVETLDTRVHNTDIVSVDGLIISFSITSSYFVFNKPAGYEVTSRAHDNTPTIYRLLPKDMQELKYAGRLDRESRGLLLLSNDGEFIQAVTHPSHRLTKTYIVKLKNPLELLERDLQKIMYQGVEDGGDLLRAVRVNIIDTERKSVEIVLQEGRKRQIRRMFDVLGYGINDLFRTAVGFYDLRKKPLPEGKFVSVDPEEIFYGQDPRKKMNDKNSGTQA